MTADGLQIDTDQSRHESTGQTRIFGITEMNSLSVLSAFIRDQPDPRTSVPVRGHP
jgi:hypothetical protein